MIVKNRSAETGALLIVLPLLAAVAALTPVISMLASRCADLIL